MYQPCLSTFFFFVQPTSAAKRRVHRELFLGPLMNCGPVPSSLALASHDVEYPIMCAACSGENARGWTTELSFEVMPGDLLSMSGCLSSAFRYRQKTAIPLK